MTIAFATHEVQEKMKKLGVLNNLQELIANCKSRSFDEARGLFDVRYPYLYKRVSNYRLVVKVETVKEIKVICILDILRKGDKDSDDFNANPFKFGQEKLEKLLDHNALDDYVQKEIQEGIIPDTKKKPLSDELTSWLQPFERASGADDLILESHQWVNKFQSKDYERLLSGFFEIVKSISSSPADFPVTVNSRIFEIKDEKSGRSVLYTKYLLDENQDGNEFVIFLLDARKPGGVPATQDSIKEFEWVDEFGDIIKNIDVIAPYAGRSYLSVVLADEDLWYQIQTNESSNPALSAEELALLARVRHAPSNEAVLPIFINGRAGSGKSTMLYHLFSDYLHRKASLELNGEILFLTYSDTLLKTAKENIRKLVQARADLGMRGDKINVDVVLPDFDNYFQAFLVFIKKHIPEEIRIKEFPDEKYVDFSSFKKMFGKYAANVKLSPDLCWHVIRTFIKGYTLNGYLSPEDYDDLPQKEKSVSVETFSLVYRSVWEKYKESGYWDTQDLVRRVINEDWSYPKYSVVFCDESQDFTRLELDFILELLVYRDYDLGYTKYVRLPFALAGDPFQTLNPTGFRWEAIKASFYDEIVANLDPYGRQNIDFDYKELYYNYRSLAPIVRLSNLFQVWREVLFGTSDVSPQKPWRDEHIIPPRLYILQENLSEDAFFNMAENSVVILPCEQGQEDEFVREKDILLRLSKQDKYPIFQSPMTAKGLEYPRVILYGFGDACPEKFFDSQPGELNLENEYFLNKLYVAATRAMKSLIIVDTKMGKERLWKHTLGQETVRSYIEKVKNPKKWGTYLVDGVTSGDFYEPHLREVTQDPIEIARKLEESGQNDASLLRQAMEFYHRGGNEAKALHCKAKALEADGRFKQAGDEFLAQGRPDDAERCFWKGECWDDLNIWFATRDGGDSIHHQTALLMAGDRKDHSTIAGYVDYMFELYGNEKSVPVEQIQMQKAFKRVIDALLENKVDLYNSLRNFSIILKGVPSLQHITGNEKSAELFFEAEEYQLAINLWDRSGSRESVKYQQAKARTALDKKEKIFWLNRSREYQGITTLYEDSEKTEFDKDSLRLIADAYRAIGQLEDSLKVAWQTGDYAHALNIFERHINQIANEEANATFSNYFHALLSNNQLEAAYDWYRVIEKQLDMDQRSTYGKLYIDRLLNLGRWLDAVNVTKSGKSKRGFKVSGDAAFELEKMLITELARSDRFVDAKVDEKNGVTKHLRDHLSGGFKQWTSWLPIEVMGAAMEKAATMVDALAFYESLDQEELFPEQELFVHQRWLKVKSKQVDKLRQDIKNANSPSDSEKLRRPLGSRNREYEEKLAEWRFDRKAVEALPEYPVIKGDEDVEFMRKLQVDWQSPTCRIVVGSEMQVMIDVSSGSLIAFPPDALQHKADKDRIHFFSEKQPISGELQPGKGVKIFVNGKLQHDFIIT